MATKSKARTPSKQEKKKMADRLNLDSVRVENTSRRPVGGSINTGRIHKGHGTAAASASIPSQYQTIVSDNSEKKGFMSRSRRFAHGLSNENPGPGSYGYLKSIEPESTSFSKKGFGGFVSKARRFRRGPLQTGPGPGQYEQHTEREHDYNRSGVTGNFHQPIAENRDELRKSQMPAPNQYNIGKTTGRVVYDNNVAACAAFKSRSKRAGLVNKTASFPSPCHYSISDKLVSDTPKTVSAPFKSTTERKMMKSPVPFPGPGTYKPFEGTEYDRFGYKRKGFLNKHYLCISAPAMPLPPVEPQPGPGHYNLVDYQGPEKHYMSSAVFVSTTSRWTGDQLTEVDIPGPATYRPQNIGKQSFIYNSNARWI